jgi:hypothetical protein
MLHKLLSVAVVLGPVFGFTAAETMKGRILGLDTETMKIKFQRMDEKNDPVGDLQELTVVEKAVVIRIDTTSKKRWEVKDGFQAEMFKSRSGKRVSMPAVLTLKDGKVTQLMIPGGVIKKDDEKKPPEKDKDGGKSP